MVDSKKTRMNGRSRRLIVVCAVNGGQEKGSVERESEG